MEGLQQNEQVVSPKPSTKIHTLILVIFILLTLCFILFLIYQNGQNIYTNGI